MNSRSVWAIVLNWNGWRDTLACLESLLAQEGGPPVLVVCDNGSDDVSCERILAWAGERLPSARVVEEGHAWERTDVPPAFVLLKNGANRGYAAGNNPGIRLALSAGARFIWVLNNDTTAEPSAMAYLLAYAEANPRAGVMGSTIVDMERPGMVQCAGGCAYLPALTVYRPLHGGEDVSAVISLPEPGPEARLDYVHGASTFVRAEAFAAVGLLNETYFLFYEELDLCIRMKRAGYELGWCRQSIVRHRGGASVARAGTGGELACYHENLSTLKFTARFYPLLFPFAAIFRLFGKAAALCWRGEFRLLYPLFRAYIDFFRTKDLCLR